MFKKIFLKLSIDKTLNKIKTHISSAKQKNSSEELELAKEELLNYQAVLIANDL